MEYMQTDKGSFPIVRILSEIAGMFAIIKAGELLQTQRLEEVSYWAVYLVFLLQKLLF